MTMTFIININKRPVGLIIVSLMMWLSSTAQAQSQVDSQEAMKPTLVVVPAQGSAEDREFADMLAELIRVQVGQSRYFLLVTPEEISAIDEELQRQLSGGCDEASCITQIGGALGAQYMVTGRFKRVDQRLILLLKLIDIERVVAINTQSVLATTANQMIDLIPDKIGQLLDPSNRSHQKPLLPQSADFSGTKPEPLDDAIPAVIPEGIVVTGSRMSRRLDDATVATEVVSQRDIIASGAETLADLLEEHPGVDVSRSFRGAGLRLQGLDEKHVLILMDGERTGGRIGGALDLSRIPISAIERVEIVKGPSSALYGSDAMGGVINVITRGARKAREVAGKVAFGTQGMLDLSGRFGFQGTQRNSRTFFGVHRIDAYDLNPDDEATTGSGYVMGHLSSRNAYRFSDTFSVASRLSYVQRDQKGVDVNTAGAIFDRRNLTENAHFSVEPLFSFDDKHHLKVIGSYRLFRDQYILDQRNSADLDQDQETREQLVQLSTQYNVPIGQRHRLTAGGDLFAEQLETMRLLDGQSSRYRGALFLQDEWSIKAASGARLRIVPGGRVDVDSQFGTQATPKLAMRYDPNQDIRWRASYGRGFRSPDFKELYLIFENPGAGYVVEGNPDLGSESSQSVNLSLEAALNKSFWFFVNGFHNDITDLINTREDQTTNLVGTRRFTYANIDQAMTQGLETRARVRLAKHLILEAGYTLTNAQNLSLQRPLTGRARHRTTFDLRYRYRPWKLRVTTRGSLSGPRPFYEDDEVSTAPRYADPYARMSLRIAKKWGHKVTLFGRIENLLDAGDARDLAIQPRTFSGGISARL